MKIDRSRLYSKKEKVLEKSKFLYDFYSSKKYDAFHKAVDEYLKKEIADRLYQREIDSHYVEIKKLLGFKHSMILSKSEEEVIANAMLVMSQRIHDGKYTMHNDCVLKHIDVSQELQPDSPTPFIALTVSVPESIKVDDGFYFKGKFKKEKLTCEIVHAIIEEIVFYTDSKTEYKLLTLY